MDLDMGGPEEMPAGDAAAGEEPAMDDSPLLAVPPGSRDAPRLTPGAKGKVYTPVKNDRRKDAGPRTRNYAAKRSAEKSSNTIRNVFPGSEINSIPSIAKGIYEQDESTYNLKEKVDEDNLFHINESIKNILRGLESNAASKEQENEEKA